MHYLRVWKKAEMPIFFVMLFISLYFILHKQISLFIFSNIFNAVIMLIGFYARKKIFENMETKSKELNLKRIGLLKYKDNKSEVHYEIHVLLPEKPLGKNKKEVEMKILRNFIEDIHTLHQYALQHEKDVTFFGTSHDSFVEAWRIGWKKIGYDIQIMDKSLDPYVHYSKNEWEKIIHSFYGPNIEVIQPPAENWVTTFVTIPKNNFPIKNKG